MTLRTNGRFLACPVDNEWKILVASLGDSQVLSRTGICREDMLINYIDKTTKN